MASFTFVMLSALMMDQDYLQQQQIVDGDTTMLNAKLESNIMNYQASASAPMQSAMSHIKGYINKLTSKNNPPTQSQSQTYNSQISYWQTKFNSAQTNAQAYENQADSNLQASQNMMNQDGTDLQQKTTYAQAVNTIAGTLVNILGSNY